MASVKRMIQLWAKSGIRLSKLGGINAGSTINRLGASANSYRLLCSNSSGNRLDSGQISPNRKPVYEVDTLAMVRSLEAQGIPSKHAEAISSVVTRVTNESLKTISQYLVSKAEIQKISMAQDAKFSKLKSEVQSFQEQGHLLQCELEKILNNIEKMRRIELANRGLETTNLTRKLKWEIRALRVHQQAAKSDVYKYCTWALCAYAAGSVLICIIKD